MKIQNTKKDITFKEAIETTKKIIERFKKIEGKPWNVEGSTIELIKQVGELAALVMVYEDYYFANRDKEDKRYATNKDKIADELTDIIFAVIRIADYYQIDLVDAHLKVRAREDEYLKEKGV